MSDLPKVGVTVLVLKDGKFLLGQRMHDMIASGQFQTPGGHLELGESIFECAHREIKEEVDIEVENLRFACVCNVTEFPPHHYVMICLIADWKSGEPRNCEEDRCLSWNWYSADNLPTPLTPASSSSISAYQSGQLLFDKDIESK